MPNVLAFPSSDREFAWKPIFPVPGSHVAPDPARCAALSFQDFRANARREMEAAIAGLERSYARMRDCSRTLDDPEISAKLQIDIGLLEQQLEAAKSKLARLWSERP